MRAVLFFAMCCVARAGYPDATLGATASGAEVEAFTGGHTKAVWLVDPLNKDTFAKSSLLRLVAYDSREPGGERFLLDESANYHTPLITPGGNRVVFTIANEGKIYSVRWDGTGKKFLRVGAASDVWRDPKTGRVWVYAQEVFGDPSSGMVRFLIDNPRVVETVWNVSPVLATSAGAFQVSGDGRRAATTFPWPISGVAELPNAAWRKHTDGCWPSMAPDKSYLSWTFDGPHRNLLMTHPSVEKTWRIPISDAPGVGGYEVYHPRWTNDVRFMVMTGPYSQGDRKIKLWDGADGVEVHLGRFAPDFRKIEAWMALTRSKRGEFFPDVWIEGGEGKESSFVGSDAPPPPAAKRPPPWSSWFSGLFAPKPRANGWPSSPDGLVFLWETNQATNEFMPVWRKRTATRLRPVGASRWGARGEMAILGGGFVVEEKQAARAAEAIRNADRFSLEALVTTSRVPQSGPARIVTSSRGIGRRNLTLAQDGDRLIVRVRTSETGRNGQDVTVGRIVPGRPTHVVVTYEPGRMRSFIDGKPVVDTDFAGGTLDDWEHAPMLFGHESGLSRFWEGALSHVALYDRVLTREEAATNAERLLEARKAASPRRLTAEVEMLARMDPPPSDAIAPYRRALAVNSYRVIRGPAPLAVGATVGVAEWSLLDGTVPRDYQKARVGQRRTIHLEPFDEHPQLESERIFGDEGLLQPQVYYNVTSGF